MTTIIPAGADNWPAITVMFEQADETETWPDSSDGYKIMAHFSNEWKSQNTSGTWSYGACIASERRGGALCFGVERTPNSYGPNAWWTENGGGPIRENETYYRYKVEDTAEDLDDDGNVINEYDVVETIEHERTRITGYDWSGNWEYQPWQWDGVQEDGSFTIWAW